MGFEKKQLMDGAPAAAAAPEAHGLQRVAERAPDGQPMLQDEELARSFPGVSLVLGGGCDLGAGALFITTRCPAPWLHAARAAPRWPLTAPAPPRRRVIWLSSADTSLGCSVNFTQISLHAISSDTAHFPRACIYMQLEAPERDGGAGDDEEDAAPEVRLAPSDAGSCECS